MKHPSRRLLCLDYGQLFRNGIREGLPTTQELSDSVNSKARFGIRNDYDRCSKKSHPVPDRKTENLCDFSDPLARRDLVVQSVLPAACQPNSAHEILLLP